MFFSKSSAFLYTLAFLISVSIFGAEDRNKKQEYWRFLESQIHDAPNIGMFSPFISPQAQEFKPFHLYGEIARGIPAETLELSKEILRIVTSSGYRQNRLVLTKIALQRFEENPPCRIHRGVYVVDGTEYAFASLPLFNFHRVLLVDSDLSVVIYNRINIALIAMSPAYDEYKFLRYGAEFSNWEQYAFRAWKDQNQGHLPNLELKSYLLSIMDPHVWTWWNDLMRQEEFDTPITQEQFECVRIFILGGRISAEHFNLSDPDHLWKFYHFMEEEFFEIGIMDNRYLTSSFFSLDPIRFAQNCAFANGIMRISFQHCSLFIFSNQDGTLSLQTTSPSGRHPRTRGFEKPLKLGL